MKKFLKVATTTITIVFLFLVIGNHLVIAISSVPLPQGNPYDFLDFAPTTLGDACNPAMGGSVRSVYDGFANYGLYGGAYDSGPCQNTPSPSQLTRLFAANSAIATACASGICGLVTTGHSDQQQMDTGFIEGSPIAMLREVNSNKGSFACVMGVGSGGSGNCVTPSSTPFLNSNFKFWPCAEGAKVGGMWTSDISSLYSGCLSSVITPDGGNNSEVQAVWGMKAYFLNGRTPESGNANVASGGLSVTLTSGATTCTAGGGNFEGSPITINGEVSRISDCSDATHLTLSYANQSCISGCSGVAWSTANYNATLAGLPSPSVGAAYYQALVSAWTIRYYKSTVWTNAKIGYVSSAYPQPCGLLALNNNCAIVEPQDGFEDGFAVQMLIASQVNEMATQATGLTLTRGGTGNKTVTVTSSSNLPFITVPGSVMFPNGTTLSYGTSAHVHVMSPSNPTYNTPCTPGNCAGAVITSISPTSFSYVLSAAPNSASVSDGYSTVVPDPTGVESLECGNNNCSAEDGTAPVLAVGPYNYMPLAPNVRVDGWSLLPPDFRIDLTHPSSPINGGCDGTRSLTGGSAGTVTFNAVSLFSGLPGNPWTNCAHTGGLIQVLGTNAMNYFTNCTIQSGCVPPWGGPVLTTTLNAGGSGYAIGDKFTINKGAQVTGLAAGVVDAVSSGAVTSYHITFGGDSYSTGAGTATTHTSGSGSGLTINVNSVGSYGYGPTSSWTNWICASGHTGEGCQ